MDSPFHSIFNWEGKQKLVGVSLLTIPDEKIDNCNWSDELFSDCEELDKKKIEEICGQLKSFEEGIEKIIPLVIDSLYRKSNLKQILIKFREAIEENSQIELSEEFSTINFSDLLFAVILKVQDKALLGDLILKSVIPLQIYYRFEEHEIHLPNLLDRTDDEGNASFIFHARSNCVSEREKSDFLFKLLKLESIYEINHEKLIGKEALFVHRINKQNYVFDFMSDVFEIPPKLQEYARKCEFVILHVLEKEIYDAKQKVMKEEFVSSIKKVFENKKIIMMIKSINKTKINNLRNTGDKLLYFISSESDTKFEEIKDFLKQESIEFSSHLKKQTHSLTPKSKSPIEAKIQSLFQVLPITKEIFSFKANFFPYSQVCDEIYKLEKEIEEMREKVPCQSEELQKLDLKKVEEMKVELSEKVCLLKAEKRNEMIKDECHNFVPEIFKLIESNENTKSIIHILRKEIFKWKGDVIELTKSKISSAISSKNDEEKKYKSQSLLEQDFLFSNVLNEFILINESEYQEKHIETDQTKIIFKTYQECKREMIPINLVDRTSLRFGNSFLKEFFTFISTENCFENKKIYVISVIGAQSTGKSTFMNYLFRTKFETSSGRCTKGMYFNIVECEDRVLLLIDTEGLLSLDNNDHLFDNQIATFILSISNLVIINTSGEINTEQQDMLYICMHAMKYLQGERVMQEKKVKIPKYGFRVENEEQEELEELEESSESKQKPQKIIFAIQKQTESDKTPHETSLKNLKTYFKSEEKENIKFEEFFDLQMSDFFSFPPAFSPKESPYYLEKMSTQFGDCVRGFRSKIIKILDEGENYKSSLKNFYEEAENCWKAILRCGPNLMNYKEKLELQIKLAIDKKYQTLEEEQKNKLEDQLKHKSTYETKKITEIDSIFDEIRFKWESDFKNKVIEETKHLKPEQKWYEKCFLQINSNGWSIKNFTLRKIKFNLESFEREKREREYEKIYKDLIAEIQKEQKDEGEILKQLDKHKREEDSKIIKNFNIIDIENQIISEISSYFDQNESIEEYLKYYRKIKYLLEKKENYEELEEELEKLFNIAENEKPWYQKDNFENPVSELLNYMIGFLEISEQIKCLESFGEKHKREKTKPQLIELFKAAYLEAQVFSQRHSLRSLKSSESFQIRSLMRGLLVCYISEKRQKLLILNESLKENEQNFFFRKWKLYLQCAFDNRNNGNEIALNWTNKIIQQVKQEVQKDIEQQIKSKLNDLPRKISHKHLVNKALDSSFLSKNCDKNNLKQCFKFILFPEKYYFETLCKMKNIEEVKEMMKDCIIKGNEKVENTIKILEDMIKEGINGESNAKIEEIMSNYGLFNFLQNEGGTMAEIVTDKYIFGIIIKEKYFHKFDVKNKILDSWLTDIAKKSLEEVVFPEILGCEAKCPFCGIKCTLPKGHREGHDVPSDWHLLKAFNGILDIESSLPSCYTCLSEYEVLVRKYKVKDVKNKDIYNEVTTLSHLESMPHSEKWTEYFKTKIEEREFQKIGAANELKKVWGKIEKMVRKYKENYVDGEPSEETHINELNEADLDEIFYDGFDGETTTFRSCLS